MVTREVMELVCHSKFLLLLLSAIDKLRSAKGRGKTREGRFLFRFSIITGKALIVVFFLLHQDRSY